MLKLGRGRAYLLVKDHYDPTFRDPILHACLHNLAFDRQSEGSRAAYMMDIIEVSGDFAFFLDATYHALLNLTAEDEEYDIRQVYDLAGWMADDGDTDMREAITQKFLADPALGDFAGAREIIALDNEDGFIFVAEFLSEQMRQQADFQLDTGYIGEDAGLYFALENQIGDDEAKAFVEQLRTERPSITPVLDAIDTWRKQPKRRKKREPRLSYAEIKQRIEDPAPKSRGQYRYWARDASDEELLQAAHDLLAETEPKRLVHYLEMYEKRPFPLDHTHLIALAQHDDFHVAIRAITALEQIEHPDVRAFALASIERGYRIGRVVSLLQLGSNYQASDWAIIEPLTRQVTDEDDFHVLGFGVREIFDKHPTPLAIPSLLNLFQYGPCGYCREAFIDYLGKLDAIPAWLRDEAQYDANSDVRAAVHNPTDTAG